MADHKAEKARRDALRMRNATDIRVEAHAMLIQASKAYRSARAEVTR